MRHVRTHLQHDGTRLVSEQMREKLVRALYPSDLANLRAANARGMDLDEDLSALEGRNLDFVDDQRLALLDQNGGLGFQEKVLATDGGRYFSVSSADTAEKNIKRSFGPKG